MVNVETAITMESNIAVLHHTPIKLPIATAVGGPHIPLFRLLGSGSFVQFQPKPQDSVHMPRAVRVRDPCPSLLASVTKNVLQSWWMP